MLALIPGASTGYKIVGLLHIGAAIAAFGPLFVYPSLFRVGAGATIAKLHLRLVLPALAVTGILGMALVGMSDQVLDMSDTWVILAIVTWVVLLVISWFMIRPSLTESTPAARGRLSSGIGVSHLLLVLLLYLMVFKPGGPAGL